jgi:hypothetical protein
MNGTNAPTEPGLLLAINEPQRQREPLDPHGKTRGYGCDYESRRDCDWGGDCAVVASGVDFLILIPIPYSVEVAVAVALVLRVQDCWR